MADKIKAILNGKNGLKSATAWLVVTLFLSNALGLIRNILLATRASGGLSELDPYYAAFRLPDFVFNILILGAISAAFIPIYTQTLKDQGAKTANNIANTLLGTLVTIVVVTLIILWFLLPILAPHLVSNLSIVKQQETVKLARIMILSPFLFSLSYIAGAVLNAHKRFVAYSLAPLVYNLSIIVGAILLPKYGVTGVAWSVVIGALLHFLTQLPSLLSLGFRLKPIFNFADRQVWKIIRLTVPRAFSISMDQITLLGFTFLAAQLKPGALTIFSLANDLQTTPAIIFGSSLATAVFPILSEAVADHNQKQYSYYIHKTIRMSLFVVIPLTVLTFLLRAQITRLYIGLGHHVSWADTIRTIDTVAWFTLSFAAQAIVYIGARSFYALQDTMRPMYAVITGTVVTLILAATLPHTSWFSTNSYNDVASLAAAYSIGVWIQAFMMMRMLPRSWNTNNKEIWMGLRRIVLITAGSGILTWITIHLVGDGLHIDDILNIRGLGTDTVIRLFVQVLVSALVGIVSYWELARLWKMDELNWLYRFRKVEEDALAQEEVIAPK